MSLSPMTISEDGEDDDDDDDDYDDYDEIDDDEINFGQQDDKNDYDDESHLSSQVLESRYGKKLRYHN